MNPNENFSLEDMEGEIWRFIPGYEAMYMASNLGRIKGVYRESIAMFNGTSSIRHTQNKIIRQIINRCGYLNARLSVNGVVSSIGIHRAVCLAFKPNPENKRTVNHIDGSKINNKLENLEWNTHTENHLHAYRTGLKVGSMLGKKGKDCRSSKEVYQYTREGEFISYYESGMIAAEKTGLCFKKISLVALGQRPFHGGFRWSRIKLH